VVTKDHDFVLLVGQHGPPPQLVWVTCGNVRNTVLRTIFEQLWPRTADLLRQGEPLVEITHTSDSAA
jgi:predicted nuclease of predicted toxin-antitoxin system